MTKERTIPAIGTLPAAGRLLAPFWLTARSWRPWLVLGSMFGTTTLSTFLQFRMTVWTREAMDVFTGYHADAFPQMIWLFFLFAMSLTFIAVTERGLNGCLVILWRSWMTQRFLSYWLGRETYYRIERDKLLDNPDQRISEDIGLFIESCLMLTVGLYGTVVKLGTFGYQLWIIGGAAHVQGVIVPGYMFWCALAVALAELGALHLAGRSLMRLNFTKQRVEADFRFTMSAVRSSAEEIATYRGAATELMRLSGLFDRVRANMWQLLFVEMRFGGLRTFLENLSSPLPMMLMAPKYFARQVTFGEVAQVGGLFGSTVSGMLWFAQNYERLQIFRVVVARLYAIQEMNRAGEYVPTGFEFRQAANAPMGAVDVMLQTPDGRRIAEGISFEVEPSQRWLIRGASGAGKSTLLRVLAGIWPYGAGRVTLPAGAKCMFMPQRSYMPPGSLKDVLCYPYDASAFEDEKCRHALALTAMSGLAPNLHDVDVWGRRLSLGEQQRIALARALLHRPDYLLMDESTSALDEETERLVYSNLLRELPNSAIVHIAHHASLTTFHEHVLVVEPPRFRSVQPPLNVA